MSTQDNAIRQDQAVGKTPSTDSNQPSGVSLEDRITAVEAKALLKAALLTRAAFNIIPRLDAAKFPPVNVKGRYFTIDELKAIADEISR